MATPLLIPPVPSLEDDRQAEHEEISERKVRGNRVGFAALVKVISVMHVNDYEDCEIDDCYYTRQDFSRIKADLKLTVKLMQMGKLEEDTSDYTRRGTEYRTPEGAKRRALNKEIARDALLDEQDSQWDKGFNDPDSLANVYYASSRHCAQEAHRLGMQDEEDARAIDANDLPKMPDSEEKLQTGVCSPLQVAKDVRLRRRSITAFAA